MVLWRGIRIHSPRALLLTSSLVVDAGAVSIKKEGKEFQMFRSSTVK